MVLASIAQWVFKALLQPLDGLWSCSTWSFACCVVRFFSCLSVQLFMYFGHNICIHIHIGTHTHSYVLKIFLFHRLPFFTFLIAFHIRYELKAQLYSLAYPYLASPLLVLTVCLSPPWNICGTFVKNPDHKCRFISGFSILSHFSRCLLYMIISWCFDYRSL